MGGNNFAIAKLKAAALERRSGVLDRLRAQVTLQDDSVVKIVEAGPKALQWYLEFEHDRWRKVLAARRHDVTLFSILSLAFLSGAIKLLLLAAWSAIAAATYGFTALSAVSTLFTILAALIGLRSFLDLAQLRADRHAQGAVRALQTYGDSVLLVGERAIYFLPGADCDRMMSPRMTRDEFGSVRMERFGDITAVTLAFKNGAIRAQILFPPPVFDEASTAITAIENWASLWQRQTTAGVPGQ